MTLMNAFQLIRLLALGFLLCVSPVRAAGQGTPVRIALSDAMPPLSHAVDDQAQGMFREMLEALFELAPEYSAEFSAFPWARAQWLVQNRKMELFLTFPSHDRRQYAAFASEPLFTLDYSHLIYRRDNVNSEKILAARNFEDMRSLVFISQDKVAWEKEAVPAFIDRYTVNNAFAILHMAFQRKTGDFFIMPIEQAIYYSSILGYQDQLALRRVDFIPNSQVPFHIGVRKSFEGGRKLLAALEAAMQDPRFRAKQRAIERKYRDLASFKPASSAK